VAVKTTAIGAFTDGVGVHGATFARKRQQMLVAAPPHW
jgi:hypothetical protein